FCRWIQDPIPDCELELPGDDVFADLDVPAPGLAEIPRGVLDKGIRDRCEVERKGSGIFVPHPLVPVVPFCLERPALVLCDEIRFIGLEIVDASAKESAVLNLGHCLAVRAIDDVGACGTQIVLSRVIRIPEADGRLQCAGVQDVALPIPWIAGY